MLLDRLNHAVLQVSKTVPLQTVLILPFVLQTLATVGLVGYFSFRNGQQTVNDLSGQLRRGITNRIEEKLKTYTEIPHTINRFNAIAFAENNIDVDNAKGETQFWQQTLMFPSTSLIYCGSNRSGAVLGVGRLAGEKSLQLWIGNATTGNIPHFYSLDAQGKRDRPLGQDTKRFDARRRPWYKAAAATGRPTWSPIYADFTTNLPTITASVPIYDAAKSLRGVCATDFFLPQEMNRFLESLEIGKSGTAFIMERSGLLVSTSATQPSQSEPTAQRLGAVDSKDRTVQATAQYLRDHFGDLNQIQTSQLLDFKMNGNQQFVQVLPFHDPRGLDWLIVTVLPEADFMERIQDNTRLTILFCIAALVMGVAISSLTARWITRPLSNISRSATALAKGKWDQTIEVERSGDLGELATSFNQMAHQLQTSFAKLQSSNKALAQNESRLKQFLEAVPVGIAVLDAAGHPYYANQRAIQLLGKSLISSVPTEAISETYQIYLAGTEQHYPTEALPIVQALRGNRATAADLEIHHSDQVVSLEAWGTPVFDEAGNVAYAISAFQDITQRKQAEQILADYNQTLEDQIAHRTAALRASEEKFASAFRASPIAMGILTISDARYLDINDSYCRTMGYARAQVIGRTCLELNLWKHSEDRSRIFKLMAETGSLRDQEVEFRKQSGDTLIVRVSGELINLDGTVCILSLYEDMTEQKRAEAASILEERNRMAREIHDTLAQAFTGIIMQMETAKVVIPDDSKVQTLVNQTCDLAREGLAEARRSVWALRPLRLEQEGLSRALQHLINDITKGAHLQVQCQIQPPPHPLPEAIETNLLRIVQETMTNILKHASATAVFLELSFESSAIRLHIQDNGVGFNPDCHFSRGFGLIGMRERVQNLGGQLSITSQAGQGTEVRVIVPLAAALPCSAALDK